jgi:two-component system, OmpR family, sensor histidine kinase KdpD
MNDERRPSPDALLAELKRAGQGHLKIFLGAAPGVGKTYAMLRQARQRQAEGIDLVVGVVETHGRDETRRLLEGLAVVPLKHVWYGGRQLSELDLDAVLERKPQLALVDELAHTNVSGSRHEKRWQDIQELLDAGIDVCTTLNVQHLESLNDVVAQITHVQTRETVPDRVLASADQIELIDLSPDDLIKRLHEGKVYVPDAAERAVQHYFSRGNLTALRELAMRAAAERVDADVMNWRRARAVEEPWVTQERILVLVGDSADSPRLVRLGKRLADRRGASWIVAHVTSSSAEVESSGGRATEALDLAERLGAEIATLTGLDLVSETIAYARARNVTQVLVGRSRRPWWRRLLQRPLAAALIDATEDIEITIASRATATPEDEPRKTLWFAWLEQRGYGTALFASALCTGVAWIVAPAVETASLGLVYLTGVLYVAVRVGLGPALATSVLCAVSFDYFFTEPRFSFVISREDLLSLLVFLLTAFVTGKLAARARSQIEDIRANSARATQLYDFSRRLAGAVGRDDLAWTIADDIGLTLNTSVIVLARGADGALAIIAGNAGRGGLVEAERGAAEWALEHDEPAGAGTGTLPSSTWLFLPVRDARVPIGVIGVQQADSTKLLTPDQRRLLFALRDQAALALGKARLADEMERAKLVTETEKLRSALLSSVSHDLRTPLVSIKGAATTLLELDATLTPAHKHELLEDLIEETERLNRFVQNLLDMTRLSYGAIVASRDWCDMREIAGEALRRLKRALTAHTVQIEIDPADALVHTDAVLLEQVLVNLLDNAAKYSPTDVPIRLHGGRAGRDYRIRVIDAGPGIPPKERERIFDMFHRARAKDQAPAGTGLGLSICRGLVEALGGTIEALPGENGVGTNMEIRLPQPLRSRIVEPGGEEEEDEQAQAAPAPEPARESRVEDEL